MQTVTFDETTHQVVPRVLDEQMFAAAVLCRSHGGKAQAVHDAILAAAPPAPTHAGLDAMAHAMATSYPMVAIIRALDKAAPGIRHAFAPPSSAPPASGAWLPIESAPKDGTPILCRSRNYSSPFVVFWGSAYLEFDGSVALPEGATFTYEWLLACADAPAEPLYEPHEWIPLPPEQAGGKVEP